MPPLRRRTLLRGAFAVLAAAPFAVAGWLRPRQARAAEWPRDAYAAKTVEDALENLYGTSQTTPSPAVKVRAPSHAENGALVPVSFSADLPDARSMSVLVERNAHPLAAHLNLLDGAAPYFALNIKIAASADVHFVVYAGGKLYGAKRRIRVTVGGV